LQNLFVDVRFSFGHAFPVAFRIIETHGCRGIVNETFEQPLEVSFVPDIVMVAERDETAVR
jgi:ribosomal protein L35AE/L33A